MALDYSQWGNLVKLLQPGVAATLVGQARILHKRKVSLALEVRPLIDHGHSPCGANACLLAQPNLGIR
jgi:hypothetical protein